MNKEVNKLFHVGNAENVKKNVLFLFENYVFIFIKWAIFVQYCFKIHGKDLLRK